MSMTPTELLKEVYELAFGENAYYRGFFPEEVLERLQEFSDNALELEESGLSVKELRELSREKELSYRQGYLDGRAFSKDQGVHPLTDDHFLDV